MVATLDFLRAHVLDSQNFCEHAHLMRGQKKLNNVQVRLLGLPGGWSSLAAANLSVIALHSGNSGFFASTCSRFAEFLRAYRICASSVQQEFEFG